MRFVTILMVPLQILSLNNLLLRNITQAPFLQMYTAERFVWCLNCGISWPSSKVSKSNVFLAIEMIGSLRILSILQIFTLLLCCHFFYFSIYNLNILYFYLEFLLSTLAFFTFFLFYFLFYFLLPLSTIITIISIVLSIQLLL